MVVQQRKSTYCPSSNPIIVLSFILKRIPGVTLKDLDFLENKTKIQAKFEEYEEFMSVVKKDAKFFEDNNIIDYSMLVGIHHKNPLSNKL